MYKLKRLMHYLGKAARKESENKRLKKHASKQIKNVKRAEIRSDLKEQLTRLESLIGMLVDKRRTIRLRSEDYKKIKKLEELPAKHDKDFNFAIANLKELTRKIHELELEHKKKAAKEYVKKLSRNTSFNKLKVIESRLLKIEELLKAEKQTVRVKTLGLRVGRIKRKMRKLKSKLKLKVAGH